MPSFTTIRRNRSITDDSKTLLTVSLYSRMIDINNHECDEDDDGNDNNIENGDQWAATLLDRFKSKHLMCSSYA